MALIGSSNQEKIWNYLYSKISNAYGVAGLMGNLYAESALNPQNLQNSYETKLGYTDATYTAAVDNGSYTNFVKDSAGYGLAQWTYWSRKQNLLNYAQSVGASIGDLEMQLGFLYKELSESYTFVLSTLKTATNVKAASDSVLLNFERPADQSDTVKTKRANYGQTYYDKYAGTSGGSQTGGTSTMSKYYASTVIAVAVAEIGYKEKASNSNLDDKTANSGSNNYTKYARDFDEKYPNWYNGKKNGYAWCDMFVDWCFLTAFGYEAALKLLCQPEKSAGAGCTYSLGYYRNKGQFYASNPKAGDQIFFGTSVSNSSHTGLVEKVDSSKVYTIEGNTSDCVARRTYSLSDSSIIGYGRPAYDAETSTSTGSTGSTSGSTATTLTFNVGDTVNFTGTTHYVSASSTSAKTCKPGTAKVTAISKSAKHPYHLIAVTGGGSTVYGWVNESDVSAVSGTTSTGSSSTTASFNVGDIVQFNGTTHYVSASATSGKTCKSGTAKVTAISKGAKHPYHLIAESGGGSNVYGWVNTSDISTISTSGSTSSGSTSTSTTKVTASNAAKSFLKSLAGTYTVKTALNCRNGAGTSYKSLVVIPKGTSVKNYGYYTTVSGVKWLYIQFTLNNIVYTGFSSSTYLTKN